MIKLRKNSISWNTLLKHKNSSISVFTRKRIWISRMTIVLFAWMNRRVNKFSGRKWLNWSVDISSTSNAFLNGLCRVRGTYAHSAKRTSHSSIILFWTWDYRPRALMTYRNLTNSPLKKYCSTSTPTSCMPPTYSQKFRTITNKICINPIMMTRTLLSIIKIVLIVL